MSLLSNKLSKDVKNDEGYKPEIQYLIIYKDTQLQQIVDKTIIYADTDGDGKISYDEFCAVSSYTFLCIFFYYFALFFSIHLTLYIYFSFIY